MSYKYYVYFENNGQYDETAENVVLYDGEEVKTVTNKSNTDHSFHLFKGYDASTAGIKRYKDDFDSWCSEILKNPFLNIDYKAYYNHSIAVESTFKRLCKGKYEHHEPILPIEKHWFDKCYNGGLTFCNPGTHESYGYDFSSFYPSILASKDFYIPVKQGEEIFLTELNENSKKLKTGFYRVKITSNHPHVKKIFAFSSDDVYTKLSLAFAMKHKEEFKFNIDLIVDDKPNAYVYSHVVASSTIFGRWFKILYLIKKQYPKNKLIKHLLSSVWGSLSRANIIYKTWEEIEKEGLKVSMDGLDGESDYMIRDKKIYSDREYYELQSTKQPYKFNIRLMPFLVSYGRNKIAEVAMKDIEAVIRIQTDGIVFNKEQEQDFDIPMLTNDEKTTGVITWSHTNKYLKK